MKTQMYPIILTMCIFIYLPVRLFSQDKTETYNEIPKDLQASKMSVGDVNRDGKLDSADLPFNNGDLIVSGNVGIGISTPSQRLEVNGYIKGTEGLCIGDVCKKNWPLLKCAEYSNRPAGETGDSFCNNLGKTCFAVLIGSGMSYFNECSTPPSSLPVGDTHTTRCCWIE